MALEIGTNTVFLNFDWVTLLQTLRTVIIVFTGQKRVGQDELYDSGIVGTGKKYAARSRAHTNLS